MIPDGENYSACDPRGHRYCLRIGWLEQADRIGEAYEKITGALRAHVAVYHSICHASKARGDAWRVELSGLDERGREMLRTGAVGENRHEVACAVWEELRAWARRLGASVELGEVDDIPF